MIVTGIISLLLGAGAIICGAIQPSHSSGLAIGLFIVGGILVLIGALLLDLLEAIITGITDAF